MSAAVIKNESVLPSPLTKLVNFFYDESATPNVIMTIDSDALVRVWSLDSGECIGSYPIEVKGSENGDENKHNKKKLAACHVDPTSKYLVAAFDSGIV